MERASASFVRTTPGVAPPTTPNRKCVLHAPHFAHQHMSLWSVQYRTVGIPLCAGRPLAPEPIAHDLVQVLQEAGSRLLFEGSPQPPGRLKGSLAGQRVDPQLWEFANRARAKLASKEGRDTLFVKRRNRFSQRADQGPLSLPTGWARPFPCASQLEDSTLVAETLSVLVVTLWCPSCPRGHCR